MAALCLGALVLAPDNGSAASRVLDSIDVKKGDNGHKIIVKFNLPVSYITHAPADKGDNADIKIRLDLTKGFTAQDLEGREIQGWKPTVAVPLKEVTYEGSGGDRAGLVLRFEREVRFKVAGGSDRRSIVVTVPRIDGGNTTPPPAAGTGEQAPAAAAAAEQGTGVDSTVITGDKELSPIMEEAAAAMTEGNYRRAIQLYTKVLRKKEEGFQQEAQELLGLARERNKQLAHAKAEYEEYLRLYPEGEGTKRVKQRLAGILTAAAKPKRKLQEGKTAQAETDENEWDTEFFGGFSQFYSRDESFTDFNGRLVNQSALSNNLDVNGRVRNQDYEFTARATGSLVQDIYTEDPPDRKSRVTTLYMDGLDRENEIFLRLGRQSRSEGGVLGRYDGGLLSYQAFDKVKFNAVGGFPVEESTSKSIELDKYFYGISADIGTIDEHWDGNIFAINQRVDGINDRTAIGGEIRYFDENFSAFSLVDYDVMYNKLNLFLATGGYTFADKTRLNVKFDYRANPIMTTSSAVIGQGVESVSQLLNNLDEDEIRDLAEDRTAEKTSGTISLSRPLTENWQISGEFTASSTTSTEASGGAPARSGTGTEFFYSGQLIGSNLLKEGDINLFGVRYSDTADSDTWTLDVSSRYPITRNLRINPRIRTDFRTKERDDSDRIRVSPSVRLNYRIRKFMQLEFELGGEWVNERRPDEEAENEFGYFLLLGYRLDF